MLILGYLLETLSEQASAFVVIGDSGYGPSATSTLLWSFWQAES